jgi:phosphotransferase system enzyme I (PtsP)
MAFVALGFNRLSMPASGIGPIKRMILSLNAQQAKIAVDAMLDEGETLSRERLQAFARKAGVLLD